MSDFEREEWLAKRGTQKRTGRYIHVSTSLVNPKTGAYQAQTINAGRNAAKRAKRAKK